MERAKLYQKLFTSTFYLSAFTFGGGYVIIPLMKRKFVDELKWLEENDMLDMAAIAQSAPGAVAVNAAILLGYRLAGIPGALITVGGTVLPPLILLILISFCYDAFRTNILVNALLTAMQPAIVAIICDVVISMTAGIAKEKKYLPFLIMAAAFTASCFLHVNVILIVLFCALLGLGQTLCQERRGGV